MPAPQQIFNEYVQLRKGGLEATTVLQMLRGHIEQLPAVERAAIVKQVKVWEAQHVNLPQPTSAANTPLNAASAIPAVRPVTARVKPAAELPQALTTGRAPAIQPIAPLTRLPTEETLVVVAPVVENVPPPGADAKQIACPHCGKLNGATAVLCYSCGCVLIEQSSPFATVTLESGDGPAQDDSYFGPNATLVLHVRGSNKTYRVQPQKEQHEVIIGRSDGSSMQPDVDLADQNAGQIGVSRLHLSIQYSSKHNTISISDLNSANGTFVNGQKLHPHEVRVLRHGDELRLGRMVFQILFLQMS
jgi:hypothetical protein